MARTHAGCTHADDDASAEDYCPYCIANRMTIAGSPLPARTFWRGPAPSLTRNCVRTIPFGGPIEHGQAKAFPIYVDYDYLPRRLVIAPECASYYEVVQIQVGKVVFLAEPMAASAFPPLPAAAESDAALVALFNKFDFFPIPPNTLIEITVRHRDVCPVHPDCVALAILCKGVPLQAHLEGVCTY